MSISVTKNQNGQPALAVQQSGSPVVNNQISDDRNGCAKFGSVLGDILDGLLSGLTLGMTNIFGAGGLFGDLINPRVPNLDNVGGFTNLSSMISSSVIMPAGMDLNLFLLKFHVVQLLRFSSAVFIFLGLCFVSISYHSFSAVL
jgi:hypothetical protein